MSNIPKDRFYWLHMETLPSKESQKRYTRELEVFMGWANFKTYESLAKADGVKLTEQLQDYVIHMKKRMRNNEIRASTIITANRMIQSFLDYHDVAYAKKKINKLLPKINKPAGNKPYPPDMIESMFKVAGSKRNRALVLFLPSCGGRRGMISGLRIRHMIPIDDPDVGKCYALRVYAEDDEDENAEYLTFASPEASSEFDLYLEQRKSKGEIITGDSFAFVYEVKSHKSSKFNKDLGLSAECVGGIIKTIIRNAKLERKKTSTNPRRYEISQVHGFRHFFRTGLTKAKVVFEDKEIPVISSDDKEKLMGHRSTSKLEMRYYDADIDELFKEYKKAIPFLTIQKSLRQQKTIRHLQEQINRKDTELSKTVEMLQTQERHLSDRIEKLEQGKPVLTRQRKQEICKEIYEELNGPLNDEAKIQIAVMTLERYAPYLLKSK